MELVRDDVDDEENLPRALIQAGFTLEQVPSMKRAFHSVVPPIVGLAASPIDKDGEPLLSPYTPTFLSRGGSSIPSPLPSPSHAVTSHGAGQERRLSTPSKPVVQSSSSRRIAERQKLTPASSLAFAMRGMQYASPAKPVKGSRHGCPLIPQTFCVWADSQQNDDLHVYTNLDRTHRNGEILTSTVLLEDLHQSHIGFDKLVGMFNYLPCQFLHANVQLELPAAEDGIFLEKLHTRLDLLSMQDLQLTSVVSVHANGLEIMSVQEPVHGPYGNPPTARRAAQQVREEALGESRKDHGPRQPSTRHRFSYESGFASEFWSEFLRGQVEEGQPLQPDGSPSLSKNHFGRQNLQKAISSISVVQEFVVKADEQDMGGNTVENAISPGSSLGNVVLVVVYEFSTPLDGAAAPTTLSHLTMLPGSVSPRQLSPPRRLASGHSTPAIHLESDELVQDDQTSAMRPRPNLTVSIPAPSGDILDSNILTPQHLVTPITPALQIMHTPPHEYFYKA